MFRVPVKAFPLAAALALAAGALAQTPPQGARLPDGPARPVVEQKCAVCHDIRRIAFAGYDRPGWEGVVARMKNLGAQLTPAETDQIVAYLAANFPDRRPPAMILAGPARVSFQEWKVPTAGSRPHDPLATPDGAVWYTGQMANVLGRVDPVTGKIREYKLPHANSGPHGLVADAEGRIWFTANFAAYIGRLDPRTGDVVEFKMPDPAARDPHTLLFGREGQVWFTVQGGNFFGRLDPKSGAVKLVKMSTPRANPYGIVLDSKGVPFFDEFGTNRIGRADPQTLEVKDYILPEGARPRRIAITPDDMVWYTDYQRGYLGRLDPRTAKVTEWPSPSGPQSQPYAITVLNGIVWYAESNTRPNALVRFDPKTETFQSVPIPAGGGVVRNMVVAPGGKLALAESGVDIVALATVR